MAGTRIVTPSADLGNPHEKAPSPFRADGPPVRAGRSCRAADLRPCTTHGSAGCALNMDDGLGQRGHRDGDAVPEKDGQPWLLHAAFYTRSQRWHVLPMTREVVDNSCRSGATSARQSGSSRNRRMPRGPDSDIEKRYGQWVIANEVDVAGYELVPKSGQGHHAAA
jgi:hypothetical protein